MEFLARDFRKIARDKLKNRWGRSLAVSLVAALLGGIAFGDNSASVIIGGVGQVLSTVLVSLGLSTQAVTDVLGELKEFNFNFNFGDLAGGFGAASILSILMGIGSLFGIAFSIGILIVSSGVGLGHKSYYIGLCNNRDPEFAELFNRFSACIKAWGLNLFMGLFIFLWSLLLGFPGIIAAYRYSMAPYLMAQWPNKGIRECVNESKALMRGHKWRLFCLDFSFIGWWLLNILTLGIGTLWLNPYIHAAKAAFYLDRTGQGIPLSPNSAPDPGQAAGSAPTGGAPEEPIVHEPAYTAGQTDAHGENDPYGTQSGAPEEDPYKLG